MNYLFLEAKNSSKVILLLSELKEDEGLDKLEKDELDRLDSLLACTGSFVPDPLAVEVLELKGQRPESEIIWHSAQE
jgi:hypothetical protein